MVHRKRIPALANYVSRHARGTIVQHTFLVLLAFLCNVTMAFSNTIPPTKNANISIQGSWAGIKLMSQLIRNYEQEQGSRFILFIPRDSNQVPETLQKHQCDVGMMLDSLKPDLGRDFEERFDAFPMGRLVVHVAVNAKNPKRTITLEELRDIFRGQATSWKDVPSAGYLGRIELYAPLLVNAESSIFRKKVMQGAAFAPSLYDDASKSSRQKLSAAEVIGAVGKQTNAIGFFLQADEKELDKRVRILRIAKDNKTQAVAPSVAAISDGSYALWDTLTLYLHPDAPPAARDFCKFANGEKAVKIVKQFEIWPEYELQQPRGRQHLAEVKRHNAAMITVGDLTGSPQLLDDLAVNFMKVKTAVQLSVQVREGRKANGDGGAGHTVSTPQEIEKKLLADGNELLLVECGQSTAGCGTKTPTLQSPSPDGGPLVLGRMAVGIIVHPKNMLDALPLQELRGIFRGDVLQWPAASGAAASMHAYGLYYTDPTAQLLKTCIAEGSEMPLKYDSLPDNHKVILEVARDPTAIGFVDLSQLPSDEKSVKLLNVYRSGCSKREKVSAEKHATNNKTDKAERNGPSAVVGSRLSSRSARFFAEDYPLATTFLLYVSPQASEVAKDFAQFTASEHGAETLVKHRIISPWRVVPLPLDCRTDNRGRSLKTPPSPLRNKP